MKVIESKSHSGCAERSQFQCARLATFLFFCIALVGATTTHAATIALDLTCSLNGLSSSGSCSPGPSFGTVSLEDLAGVDAGKVKVTVDLGFPSTQKFRELILNYAGAATSISSSDGSNPTVLNSNGYSITPYNGLFDLGNTGSQGWNATTAGPYSATLSGDAPLAAADFFQLDSLGNLYAAIHIQNIGSASGGDCDGSGDKPACVPGMPGTGSLKIGATISGVGPPFIPEPSTVILLAGCSACLAAGRRRR